MTTDSAVSRGALFGLEGTLFDGRFRVEARIAEGGFAVVYRAWQVALDRRVALKVLKAPRSQDEIGRAEFREKFAAEAKTIAKLRHLHIVDVYDFSVATLPSGELAPWMALEWLEGETLATHLERRRRAGERGRNPLDAVDFLRPVLQALAHAHGHGIAHRDIKPSNIMVTATENGESLRVLDFGIAKIMLDDHAPNTGNTRTESAPAFSPAYAAPEQVAFSRTGPWTDVHALGLILAEVMTDEPPFSDPDPEAHLFEQVMARSRPTPASKGRDVGPFEPILAKALALSPRDRWRSAGELLAALEDAKAGGAAFLAAAGDTAPATVVEGVGRSEPERKTRTRALGLTGAVTLMTAIVLVGAVRIFSAKNESSELGPSRPAAKSAAAPRIEPAPAPAPALLSTLGQPQPSATATATPAPPMQTARRKKALRVAPAPTHIGDGRDLFNDTK